VILPEHYGLPAREVRPLPGGYHRSSFVVDGTHVLCHTDVGGDNILATPSGGLVLLDWDEAVLGPAENDFALFARDEPPGSGVLRTVLDGYGAPIDPVRLAFCQLRRYLGDACVRLRRLAEPDCPDRSAVEADLVEWGVRPWRALADPH
jgi:Phosphotransferase enzyme family